MYQILLTEQDYKRLLVLYKELDEEKLDDDEPLNIDETLDLMSVYEKITEIMCSPIHNALNTKNNARNKQEQIENN